MDNHDIKDLQKKYNLSYHVNFCLDAEKAIGLKGKKVLEVGGSLPEEFVIGYLGAKSWIALEELNYYNQIGDSQHIHINVSQERMKSFINVNNVKNVSDLGDYSNVSGKIEELNESFFGQFDVVFSIAAFEHISHFPSALSKMYDALSVGGKLFSAFSPVWSAYNGHHLHGITDKDGNCFHFNNNPIPPWSHLLLKPSQMYSLLLKRTDPVAAQKIVYEVYHSPSINRLFTEDYINYIRESKFQCISIRKTFPTEVPIIMAKQLSAMHPGFDHFDNNGMEIILQK